MNNKPFTAFLILVFCAFGSAASAQSRNAIDAGRGDIPLVVPNTYNSELSAPLIVLLHGYGSSGEGQDNYMKFSELADRYGFLLATLMAPWRLAVSSVVIGMHPRLAATSSNHS